METNIKFHWYPFSNFLDEICGQTDAISHICIQFVHFLQRTFIKEHECRIIYCNDFNYCFKFRDRRLLLCLTVQLFSVRVTEIVVGAMMIVRKQLFLLKSLILYNPQISEQTNLECQKNSSKEEFKTWHYVYTNRPISNMVYYLWPIMTARVSYVGVWLCIVKSV